MNQINELSAEEFAERISKDNLAIIIDVRTPQEFCEGHIANSVLMDIYNPTFKEDILNLDKNISYYLYCRSGSRSYQAGYFMLSNGFENVSHLKGGIFSWNDNLEV
jgi:rhodanese-related sulfurtransferase